MPFDVAKTNIQTSQEKNSTKNPFRILTSVIYSPLCENLVRVCMPLSIYILMNHFACMMSVTRQSYIALHLIYCIKSHDSVSLAVDLQEVWTQRVLCGSRPNFS